MAISKGKILAARARSRAQIRQSINRLKASERKLKQAMDRLRRTCR